MSNLKFVDVFRYSTISMRINGCYPAIFRNNIFWIIQFTLIAILNVVCTYLLVNSILFHDIPDGRYTEASKNSIMVIVAVTINFKYLILLYRHKSITNLIHNVDEDYDVAKELSVDEQKIISDYSKQGVKVCKLWMISAVGTSAMFPLKACWLMGCSYWTGDFKLIPMFDFTYPAFLDPYKNEPVVFCAIFGICFMFGCYATLMYLGFDPVVPIFMLHTCGQIELISRRIMILFSEGSTEDEIRARIKNITIKLQEIYRFMNWVQDNFTFLYEFNMKTTTFLMPLTAFQIVNSLHHKEINIEFIGFFTGVILHFYMPSYYSDLLKEKSERLRQAVYSCGWENISDIGTRKTVLFMLARTRRPLVLSTVFYPICLNTFAEMCRQSYAIFNIMNAAWL